jgi:predicted PurR-regulated permease PerM
MKFCHMKRSASRDLPASGGAPSAGVVARLIAADTGHSQIAERVLMALLIGGIAVGCGFVLWPFLSALLGAAILVFTTWPVFAFLHTRLRLPRSLVALIMVALTALVLVLPLSLAIPGGAAEVHVLRHSLEAWLADIPPAPAWLNALPLLGPLLRETWNGWASDLSSMTSFFRPYLGMFAEGGLSLVLSVAGGLVQFFVALFVAFFFWYSGASLGAGLQSLVHRVAGRYAAQLIATTTRAVRGTVYGILGTAIIQGFLTAFGLSLAGVPRVVLLGIMAAFLAVLPIGAPLIWIPAALWLLSDGHTARGVFLLVYGVIVVSGADHVIRPYFIARGARIPFLLTVLGVLGGVLAFGALGIFLGPVLLAVGYMLVIEFGELSHLTEERVEEVTGDLSGKG